MAYIRSDWKMLDTLASLGLHVTIGGGLNEFFFKRGMRIRDKGYDGSFNITPMFRLGTHWYSLQSGLHPLLTSKTFRALAKTHGHGSPALVASLQQPATKATVLGECRARTKPGYFPSLATEMSDHVFPFSSTDLEPREDMSVKAVGEARGTDAWEIIYEVLAAPEDPSHHGIIIRPLYNYKDASTPGHQQYSLNALFDSLSYGDGELILPGFADGGAHTKLQCEATTPTTMLSFWCRDRTRGPLLPVELAVVPSARVAFSGDFVAGERAGSVEGAALSGMRTASALKQALGLATCAS